MDYAKRLGWILPEERTAEQQKFCETLRSRMPPFYLVGPPKKAETKVMLTDVWKHPTFVSAFGKPFTGFHQLTGSCVGAGGGNVLQTLANIQAMNGITRPSLVFWPLTYGRGRLDAGMTGQGEGSMGAAEAQAAKEDGVLTMDFAGLPQYRDSDGQFTLTEQDEMKWSDGAAIPSPDLVESRLHLVKTVSPLSSSSEVAAAIQNYYPVTIANPMYVGHPSIQKGVLLGKLDANGGHQTSIQGYWNHPTLGEIFYYMNQWGQSCYGGTPDPGGGPLGGCWISKVSLDWICQHGEVYSYSQWDGYPVQSLNFLLG